MVFLGVRYPTPASRRVATDHGAARGFNYAPEHVGASRSSPPAPPSKPASSRDAEPRGGFRLSSLPYATDTTFVRVGAGAGDFARAKRVMQRWGHFQLGWSEVDPDTGVAPGDPVCVCANILGVWIRNPLEVVYNESGGGGGGGGGARGGGGRATERFTFAHGCLEGHLLAGEEAFVLERREDDSVWYGVNTFSRPAHPLALVGYPAVRALQWKFARDSTRAVREGVRDARAAESVEGDERRR